jgi:hypothetical protein
MRNFKSIIALATLTLTTSVLQADDPNLEFFEKQIRPLLVNHCYECHGPEEASGKLRLDTKAGWIRGGERGPAIVPGDPSASLLMRAVKHQDTKLRMPPPDAEKQLTARQIRNLETWIRQGAIDPRQGAVVTTAIEKEAATHWAFQPVQEPQLTGQGHPVDQFINRQLATRKLIATATADMRTLIRRATYDLHGLPPTVEQLATPRDQFPQLINTLLASPRYGERWGRHWLDVARYSDAKDGVLMYGDARIRPFAYTYRDYVIRAFNDDKPFDQFVREQLAADQMQMDEDSPNLAAMGLLTLGRMFDRNPHDVIDDRIDVVTRGFLGLTVSCARCHDHKFDPLPTADYYSLYGVFASSSEPYQRPRIEAVSTAGQAYEKELQAKFKEVFSKQDAHYRQTLQTARERTADYLVQVATTEPDISETSIFFLSLIPEQLRPHITYRWRKLIARRAYADDPIFGPWADLMQDPTLQVDRWKKAGVDPRIIAGLVKAKPRTPEQIARTYGQILRDNWGRKTDLQVEITSIDRELSQLREGKINLVDIVSGGNGFGTGKPGGGIHPGTGQPTTGQTSFIEIPEPDKLIPVKSNPLVDGVFVPKGTTTTISTSGLTVTDLLATTGKTWDYFKDGSSSGSTAATIDGIDFSAKLNQLLAMHANKGITFDLQAIRTQHDFQTARFKGLFGHGGAKDQSQLDFAIYLDAKRVLAATDFPAQGKGLSIDLALPKAARFLTLVVTEGKQGISHDQAIIGNPRIVPDKGQTISAQKQAKITALEQRKADCQQQLKNLPSLEGDPLAELLVARESPIWFPKRELGSYLSRQAADAFRGLVGQLDGIGVKHATAAGRAMVLVDNESLYDPVIFQRGDPAMPGTPVPRQFLRILAGSKRQPFPNGSGRLDLAKAIASPDNPLTARVWANRVWMHHLGKPLVENPSDFGLRTKRPPHHELLDFLAFRLVQDGWSTKSLHRLIMTSAAYQRSSLLGQNERLRKQTVSDPENRLIWRGNRRRLDLEQMRDTMLVASGKINYTMFGRPTTITDLANFRRTVYAFVERQNLPNVIQTFDFANADTSTARRTNTTVPQQALFAMNSQFVSQAAQLLADRFGKGTEEERIEAIYQAALGRSPSAEETELGKQFVKENPWQQYTQIILMTNELMFLD